MKKVLSIFTAFVLVFTMFALSEANVDAANTCTTTRTVIVHYKRWDNDYTNMDFWTWGNGTNGSVDQVDFAGEDDFGKYAYFCVDDDAGLEAGLIARTNDWSYKDGIDTDGDGTDNKFIPLKDDNGTPDDDTDDTFVGFDANGEKHVYVLQGSNEVYTAEEGMPFFQEDGLGTLVIVYYDPAQSYEGWNIWNWGTGTNGTAAGDAFDGSGVPFQFPLGEDQGSEPGKYRVAVINVDDDADDTMGFIVRTDSWEKKYADDLFIDISGIKGSGTQFTFYIAGEGDFYDNFTDFEAQVNLFEIESTRALDPTSVEVTFNKEVITKVDDVDVFDATDFTVTDKDGTELTIDQVSYDSTTDTNTIFTLILEEALTGDMGPYNVNYTSANDGVLTQEFTVDSDAPSITIIGSKNVELELGDSYSLPTFTATDMKGEEAVQVYTVNVKDGHGTVDTRNAGVYEVVLTANDKFGNVAEDTITVTVIDPCDETAHLDAKANGNVEIISLLVGLPLAFGAMLAIRRYQ